MTGYGRGDGVFVSFVFRDEMGLKRRPALTVSSDAYHRSREEAIIAAITSRTNMVILREHLIGEWREAGLLLPPVAAGIVRTIKQGMIARRLGVVPKTDMEAIDSNLRLALGLSSGGRQ